MTSYATIAERSDDNVVRVGGVEQAELGAALEGTQGVPRGIRRSIPAERSERDRGTREQIK